MGVGGTLHERQNRKPRNPLDEPQRSYGRWDDAATGVVLHGLACAASDGHRAVWTGKVRADALSEQAD